MTAYSAFCARLRQVSVQWLATLYVAMVSLGISVLLARQMGPESFGAYSYVLGIVTLLALLQSAGFSTLLLRERIAPTPALAALAPRLPGLAQGHLLITSIVMIVGAAILLPFPDASRLVSGILCFGAITLSQQVSARLRSTGEFGREARWQMSGRTLSALLIAVVALTISPRPSTVFIAWGCGLLLMFCVFPFKDRPRPDFHLASAPYRATLGFFLIELATNFYHRIDIVILHHLLGEAPEVGHYAAAYRLFDGVLLLIAPVALILFRELRLRWQDADALRYLNGRALLVALGLGIFLAAVGYLLAPLAVQLLFGEQYAGGPAGWLFLGFVVVVPNAVLTQFAIATNRERWYALCAAFAALLNIALNFALIPAYGITGAAWALLATEAGLGITLCLGIFRREHWVGKRFCPPPNGGRCFNLKTAVDRLPHSRTPDEN